jgi:hypothetical protein
MSYKWSNINLIGNTTQGQNIGNGCGIFKEKILGTTLVFRSISAGDNIKIESTKSDTELVISSTALGTGTVTSITAGTGLCGGTITTSGTISACFGTTAGTIAQGNDSRFHSPVTLSPTKNGLNLSGQELSIALACTNTIGVVSNTTQTFGGLKTFQNAIIVGDTTTTNNGAIRYNSTTSDLEGRVNGSWVSLTTAASTLNAGTGICIASNTACLDTTYTDGRYLNTNGDNANGTYCFSGSSVVCINNSNVSSYPLRVTNHSDGTLMCMGFQAITSQIRYCNSSLCFIHNNTNGFNFNCNVTAPNFTLSSDISLKENISNACIFDSMIKYKTFNLKSNPNEMRYGVIAQEIEPYYPELVSTNDEGIKSVKYVDLLVREIAYLKNKVNELEKKIIK